MKSFAIAALIATTQAAIGESCFYVDNCADEGLECISWYDSSLDEDDKMCEDCSGSRRSFIDPSGNEITFVCAIDSAPKQEAPAAMEEEGASSLALSAAALITAVSVIAWEYKWTNKL